jgi:hypothetical protein
MTTSSSGASAARSIAFKQAARAEGRFVAGTIAVMRITPKSLGHFHSDYSEVALEHSLDADKAYVPISMWIVLGVVVTFGVSASIGLALGRVLGSFGRDLTDLLEAVSCRSLPPARARASSRA